MTTEAALIPISLDELNAIDLREEVATLAETDPHWTCTAFRVVSPQIAEVGNLLYVSCGRAGIAWGADAAWTDCIDEEDALRRYLADELDN